jgi:hypothetical protein
MTLLIYAIIGASFGYIAIWSSVIFNKTLEERVRSLLLGVVIDVIMLILFAMNGQGAMFTWMLIFKYLFLAAIDLDKTLRQ